MDTDFRALLLAAVTSLVSTRVSPTTYPQNSASPAVRYRKITGAPGLHMQRQRRAQLRSDAGRRAGRNCGRNARNPRRGSRCAHAYAGTQGSTAFQLIQLRDDRGVNYETNGAQQFYTTSLDLDVIWRAA
jgi:hypothetical protein